MDGAAAIFDGVADVFCDCDRGAIVLLISAAADGKDSAAEQLVLPAHAFPPSSINL